MTSPKHLWSGDWERESDARPAPPVALPPRPDAHVAGPAPVRAEPAPRRTRPSRRLTLGLAVVVFLLVVGVAVALTTGGSSPNRTHSTAALAPAAQTPAAPSPATPPAASPNPAGPNASAGAPPTQTVPVQLGPTYTWLGMQISETPAGLTVATVTMNGAGDLAGVNPGDVIESANGQPITSVASLRAAVAKLRLGQTVSLTVSRGSTPVQLAARLSNRPVRQR